MLTSRSEYRLLLRQDNADARLTPLGHQIGLVDEFRWQVFQAKQAAVQTEFARLKTTKLDPNEANAVLAQADSSPLSEKTSLFELLRRPEIGYDTLARLDATSAALNLDNRPLTLFCETEIKYEGYIKRQQQAVGKLADAHKIAIPAGFDYKGLKQLSNESREKLDKLRPTTLAQAMRINGVTPADASILQVVLSR
ncbi:MAG: hypothetical protein R2857_06205 [Vampirovibrionales bacterium]